MSTEDIVAEQERITGLSRHEIAALCEGTKPEPPPTFGLCGDCVFWERPEQRTDFTNIWRDNESDKQYGRCREITLGDGYEEAPDPLPLAVTKDGSDYKADLFTRADFGCVLHESTEE